MKKLIILVVVVSLVMGITNMAFAQKEKNPTTAVLWSLLVTGGGQIYNKETIKGLLMLGRTVVCTATLIKEEDTQTTVYGSTLPEIKVQTPQLIAIVGLKIWSMVDAYQGANKFNDNLKKTHAQRINLLLDEKKTTLAYKCSF